MSELAGLMLAFGFGCAYAWWVSRQQDRSLVALWVVFGVAVTLLIAACVPDAGVQRLQLWWPNGEPILLSNHAHAALYVGKFFVASGTPMVLTSLWRHYWGL